LKLSRPPLFAWAAHRRSLLALAALTLVAGAAMLPAMATMDDHGASLFAFESAGSAARSQEILADWGDAGKAAMWWQLALTSPSWPASACSSPAPAPPSPAGLEF
jgi:hypothetical protein